MIAVTKTTFCANDLPAGTPIKVQYQYYKPFYALILSSTPDKLEIMYINYNDEESYGDPSITRGYYPERDTINIDSIIDESVKIEAVI